MSFDWSQLPASELRRIRADTVAYLESDNLRKPRWVTSRFRRASEQYWRERSEAALKYEARNQPNSPEELQKEEED